MQIIKHNIEDFVMATGMPVGWYLKGAEQDIEAHRKAVEANKKNGVAYHKTFWIDRAIKELELARKKIELDGGQS